ncbi:siphovirus ReqiPepy6 Gp37-like family protein [Clostridium subterminale]|uniref:Siphovirus ReqiPepy6 Gp37-like family protein n=1 Tax=Clostridium subterminale TaxID=1550 RepID=A0ABP3W159_CLOSU
MELYVFNPNIERMHIVDVFTSLIWTRKYHKPGEFELHVPLTTDNINYLTRGNIIYKKGDNEAGYIETRQIALDEKGNETLLVKGKFITNYLNIRINWSRVAFIGLTEVLMRKLVNDNAVNPTDIKRKIPLLSLGTLKNYTESINYQNSYGNLITELENLSNTSELGYRVNFDQANKNLKFEVYKGVNRSVNQSLIAPCVFSREFENILSQTYFESDNGYKNTALVAGEGEGDLRVLCPVNNTNEGLNRKELFVDARDLQKTVDGVTYTEQQYNTMLLQRGLEKLAEYSETKTFDSVINTKGNNVYKKDYDLGDIVTIQDKKWGLRVDTRITEIQEVYEGGKVEINPTFGTNIPTITDKIKRMVK